MSLSSHPTELTIAVVRPKRHRTHKSSLSLQRHTSERVPGRGQRAVWPRPQPQNSTESLISSPLECGGCNPFARENSLSSGMRVGQSSYKRCCRSCNGCFGDGSAPF